MLKICYFIELLFLFYSSFLFFSFLFFLRYFQAEETEILMSELAKIVGGERALVEECGDLLTKTYASQV